MILTFHNKQFLMFVLIGVINTLFSYSVYALFIAMGLHYVYAVFLATCLGVLFNFKTIGGVVFRNKNNRLIVRFIAVYGLLYFINIAIIHLTGFVLASLYIRGAIATLCLPLLSYALNKKFVFKS